MPQEQSQRDFHSQSRLKDIKELMESHKAFKWATKFVVLEGGVLFFRDDYQYRDWVKCQHEEPLPWLWQTAHSRVHLPLKVKERGTPISEAGIFDDEIYDMGSRSSESRNIQQILQSIRSAELHSGEWVETTGMPFKRF